MTALLVGFFWTHHGWRNGKFSTIQFIVPNKIVMFFAVVALAIIKGVICLYFHFI